jgi:hypothetical protein
MKPFRIHEDENTDPEDRDNVQKWRALSNSDLVSLMQKAYLETDLEQTDPARHAQLCYDAGGMSAVILERLDAFEEEVEDLKQLMDILTKPSPGINTKFMGW